MDADCHKLTIASDGVAECLVRHVHEQIQHGGSQTLCRNLHASSAIFRVHTYSCLRTLSFSKRTDIDPESLCLLKKVKGAYRLMLGRPGQTAPPGPELVYFLLNADELVAITLTLSGDTGFHRSLGTVQHLALHSLAASTSAGACAQLGPLLTLLHRLEMTSYFHWDATPPLMLMPLLSPFTRVTDLSLRGAYRGFHAALAQLPLLHTLSTAETRHAGFDWFNLPPASLQEDLLRGCAALPSLTSLSVAGQSLFLRLADLATATRLIHLRVWSRFSQAQAESPALAVAMVQLSHLVRLETLHMGPAPAHIPAAALVEVSRGMTALTRLRVARLQHASPLVDLGVTLLPHLVYLQVDQVSLDDLEGLFRHGPTRLLPSPPSGSWQRMVDEPVQHDPYRLTRIVLPLQQQQQQDAVDDEEEEEEVELDLVGKRHLSCLLQALPAGFLDRVVWRGGVAALAQSLWDHKSGWKLATQLALEEVELVWEEWEEPRVKWEDTNTEPLNLQRVLLLQCHIHGVNALNSMLEAIPGLTELCLWQCTGVSFPYLIGLGQQYPQLSVRCDVFDESFAEYLMGRGEGGGLGNSDVVSHFSGCFTHIHLASSLPTLLVNWQG